MRPNRPQRGRREEEEKRRGKVVARSQSQPGSMARISLSTCHRQSGGRLGGVEGRRGEAEGRLKGAGEVGKRTGREGGRVGEARNKMGEALMVRCWGRKGDKK